MNKAQLDALMESLGVQPVGWGYIDCICPREHVEAFLDGLAALGIGVSGLTWWCHVTPGHMPCGMGGPRARGSEDWYSEMPEQELHKFTNLEALRRYLGREHHPCRTPALWLDVPEDWRNPWEG